MIDCSKGNLLPGGDEPRMRLAVPIVEGVHHRLLIHDPLLISRVEKYCMSRHGSPQFSACLSRPAVWLCKTRWTQTVAADLTVQLPHHTVASMSVLATHGLVWSDVAARGDHSNQEGSWSFSPPCPLTLGGARGAYGLPSVVWATNNAAG